MRAVSERELCHERLGNEFESALSEYDTQRRLEVLIDEYLPKLPSGELDSRWPNWLIAQILHREAEKLIGAQTNEGSTAAPAEAEAEN